MSDASAMLDIEDLLVTYKNVPQEQILLMATAMKRGEIVQDEESVTTVKELASASLAFTEHVANIKQLYSNYSGM